MDIKKYLPWILGGGALIFLFLGSRSGDKSFTPPTPGQIVPSGPANRTDSDDIMGRLAQQRLNADIFGGLLQYDLGYSRLDAEKQISMASLANQRYSDELSYNLALKKLELQALSGSIKDSGAYLM